MDLNNGRIVSYWGLIRRFLKITFKIYGAWHWKDVSASISTTSAPIFLDLNNDGLELTHNYTFDYDSDGTVEQGTWLANAGDAVLAIDYDGDGLVTHGHEIAFAQWHQDANTDLEGLQLAFDSNQDGVLNALDERWHEFGIWQDTNQNGINESGEFKTLAAAGITSFNLTSDGQQQDLNGATIFGMGEFTYADGSTGQFADASVEYSESAVDAVGDEQIGDEVDKAVDKETTNKANEEAQKQTNQPSNDDSDSDNKDNKTADTDDADNAATNSKDTDPNDYVNTNVNAYAHEDEEIYAQVVQLQQWQQQKASHALTESEPGLVHTNTEQEELAEEAYG